MTGSHGSEFSRKQSMICGNQVSLSCVLNVLYIYSYGRKIVTDSDPIQT